MKIDEYPVYLREAWAVFCFLRTVGFSADDIWFRADDDGSVGVVLRAQGKEWSIRVGSVTAGNESAEECRRQWVELAEDLPLQKADDLDRVWESSTVCHHKAPLMAELMLYGFVFPMMTN